MLGFVLGLGSGLGLGLGLGPKAPATDPAKLVPHDEFVEGVEVLDRGATELVGENHALGESWGGREGERAGEGGA